MKKDNGMAIITVLLLTVLMVLMTVSMIFISTNHLSIIGNIEAKEKALKAAESGIEYAMYKLNMSRDWGLNTLSLSDFHEDGTVNFVRNDGFSESVPYEDGSKFTITFKPASDYRSVNNLFSSEIFDNGTPGNPEDDTPAYTAKIISVGEYGYGSNIKKRVAIQAFLVRSTYYPYTVTTFGRMVFGPSATTTLRGENTDDPGYIYSDWEDSSNSSIFAPDETKVISNGGIFSARGSINILDFDGQKMENLSKSTPLSDVDVAQIVNRARDGELGPMTVINNVGKVKITEKEADINHGETGIYKSTIEISFAGTDFENAVDVDITDDRAILYLKDDIYINGPGPVSGDETRLLTDLGSWTGPPRSNVFQIQVDSVVLDQEVFEVIEVGDDDDDDDHETHERPSLSRDIYLNLQGHSIYSNSHLILGIDVCGEGRIISKGKVAYAQGLNNEQLVCMSGDDLTIEISNRITSSYSKGFFYASDDFMIRPMADDSLLKMGGLPDRFVQNFSPSNINRDWTKLTTYGYKTAIGEYHNPPPSGEDDPPPYYSGNWLTVKRITLPEDEGGGHKLQIKGIKKDSLGVWHGDNIQFRIEQPVTKQIDFEGTIEITFIGDEVEEVIAYDPAGNPTAIDLTAEQLITIGRQLAYSFENGFMSSANIRMDATIVGMNEYDDPDPDSEENQCGLDAGSTTTGTIDIGWYPDYMKSMVYIQGLNFTVRRTSWQQIE